MDMKVRISTRYGLSVSDYPNVKPILRQIEYKRRTFNVAVIHDVDYEILLHGAYWSGGSRNEYTFVNPCQRTAFHLSEQDCSGGFPQFIPKGVKLPSGCVLIRHGTSDGKPALATIFMRVDDEEAILDTID